jgi:hypothetical protein
MDNDGKRGLILKVKVYWGDVHYISGLPTRSHCEIHTTVPNEVVKNLNTWPSQGDCSLVDLVDSVLQSRWGCKISVDDYVNIDKQRIVVLDVFEPAWQSQGAAISFMTEVTDSVIEWLRSEPDTYVNANDTGQIAANGTTTSVGTTRS